MWRPWNRLLLATAMVCAAWMTVARATEACSIYLVCDSGTCVLAYSCTPGVSCSACYDTRTECRDGCVEMYPPLTPERSWCVQSCWDSWNECMQSCAVK